VQITHKANIIPNYEALFKAQSGADGPAVKAKKKHKDSVDAGDPMAIA